MNKLSHDDFFFLSLTFSGIPKKLILGNSLTFYIFSEVE